MTGEQKIDIIKRFQHYASLNNTHGYIWSVDVANIVAESLLGKRYAETRSGYCKSSITDSEKDEVRRQIAIIEASGCLTKSKGGKLIDRPIR